MKRMMWAVLVILFGFGNGVDAAASVTVAPEQCVIVLPAQASAAQKMAAQELRKHLQLITGHQIEIAGPADAPAGKYAFHIGISTPGDAKTLAPEEARWVVGPEATYLYGDDAKASGSQFAVYCFLESQLGVRWIAPGDAGIAYEVQNPLKLTAGEYSWKPELILRKIRTSWRVGRHLGKNTPEEYQRRLKLLGVGAEFLLSPEESDAYAADVAQWQDRMRMGGHNAPTYGHAFTNWWDKYGKTHPEYFALNKWKKREPELLVEPKGENQEFSLRDRQFVKLCVSNPQVAQQIVQDWVKAGGMKRSKWINVCENDMAQGYCRCPDCLALDGRKEGEALGEYLNDLTDRYVYLANAVAREARKIAPDAWVVTYAYAEYEQPPRRQKVEPNVLVAIVPTTVNLVKLEALYGGWESAGAKALFLRPNYHTYYNTLVIPTGFEKHMFDAFQVAWKHKAVGADYDSLMGNWAVTGLCEYVLTHAFAEPSQPYEYWEQRYCQAYGPAASEVREYFQYWRTQVWEQRLLSDLDKIVEKGGANNFGRGLMWSLGDYYRTADFERTDAILQKAAAKPLSNVQRAQLEQLVLANQHARLTYQAVVASGAAKFEHAESLVAFRRQHKQDLWINMVGAFAQERGCGDIAGIQTGIQLQTYARPWVPTALAWHIALDPQDVGLREMWQQSTSEQTSRWERIDTDVAWENARPGQDYLSSALRQQLKNYDGIAWYATAQAVPDEFKGRQVFLYFGAVDESCWIFVNGQPAGQHVYEKSMDHQTPFEIRIDPFIDWSRPAQQILVRVQDKSGQGGIWRPVWLVSRMK